MNQHPFLSDDFLVDWTSLTPSAVKPDISHALEISKKRISGICSQHGELTYESTFEALENATEELSLGWGRLNHLDSVSDNAEQRSALNEMLPEVSEFYSGIALNSELWEKLRTFSESSEVEKLDSVRRRFVEETCADFRESGADLPADKKKRIAEIDADLSKQTKKFGENVLDSTNAWELIVTDEGRLAGLPDSAKAAAKADAEAKGHENAWRFTLQMPSLLPVMQHADDESLRKEVWEASSKIASEGEFDNSELIWKILKLRQEKAEILGKDNFADLTLSRRMAKSGLSAQEFGKGLHAKVKEAFEKDIADLETFKAKKTEGQTGALEPWEVAYWSEKQRKEIYDFDEEELRPYFSVDRVMSGMFTIAQKLFGITIVEKAVSPELVWDPGCKVYQINDDSSGDHLGTFYADWHPRESKRGGAWMNSLQTGTPPENGSEREPHLGLICGNMTAPVDGKAALLTHREVETIFHEFGHLIHHLLSEVPVKSLAGTNVPWDFVELPSQLMENFCWDRESLDLFARHFETDEPIPAELFDKMIAARNYQSALGFMRQLALGKLDMDLHVHLEQYLNKDLDDVDTDILDGYLMPLARKSPTIARRFSHLFSSPTGYAAGYYSYKWAEVLDADAFTRFKSEGVLNPETGMDYRRSILAKGNSQPVDVTYREFMGRDPKQEPLLERCGLSN